MANNSCEFCNKNFSRESSLINHSCEKKRRWFDKDSKHSRIAFNAWNRFYQLNKFNMDPNYSTNFKNFMNSKYYNAFMKFAKHICDVNAIDPVKFIDYVIKNNLPLDKWTHDFVYKQYVDNYIRQESAENALIRSVNLINDWSQETGKPWNEFFKTVNTHQAVMWIKSGKISPWLLYNVDSAVDFFSRCSPEQLVLIKELAPIGPWKLKFLKNQDSCTFIRDTLKQNGM